MTAPAMDMQTLLRALMQNAQQAPAEAPKKKKRKRGGLAGLWDRNKNVIKPVVSGALGMVPGIGVGLATGAGALMGGLDRPGQRGVGFDVGGAARGGLAGYTAGKAGKYLGGKVGIGRAAAPIAPPSVSQAATPTPEPLGQLASANSAESGEMVARMMQQPPGAGVVPSDPLSAPTTTRVPLPTATPAGPPPPTNVPHARGFASAPTTTRVPPPAVRPAGLPAGFSAGAPQSAGGRGLMSTLGNAAQGIGSFVNKNATAVGMGMQGVGAVMGAQAERSIADERLRLERERDEEERRRRGLTASLLLPLYQQQMQRFQP